MAKVETPYDDLTYKIIGLAMAVHSELGPGFPEEVYRRAMMVAMGADGMPYEPEFKIQVAFRGQAVGEFRLDLVVDRKAVVEFKAVDALESAHERQVISYLTASGLEIGMLINFGSARLEYKRIFPPKAIQASAAFQSRRLKLTPSVQSVSSVDEK
jgi:GxxExxY protein